MADQIGVRCDELPERRVDLVEMDVGDEAVDRRIDAARLRPVHEALRRHEAGEHREIGEAAGVGGVRQITADALEVVALGVELLRLQERRLGELRMLAANRGRE